MSKNTSVLKSEKTLFMGPHTDDPIYRSNINQKNFLDGLIKDLKDMVKYEGGLYVGRRCKSSRKP